MIADNQGGIVTPSLHAQSKGRSNSYSALCCSKRLARLVAQTQRDQLEGDFAECLAQLVAGRRIEEVR